MSITASLTFLPFSSSTQIAVSAIELGFWSYLSANIWASTTSTSSVSIVGLVLSMSKDTRLFSGTAGSPGAANAATGNIVITNIANVSNATTFFFIVFIPFFPSQIFICVYTDHLFFSLPSASLLLLLFSRAWARLSLYQPQAFVSLSCGSSSPFDLPSM